MKTLGIIPARYASTRFPGKPLADIKGKPMIQLVYEQALKAELLNKLIVATDDERIYKAVHAFGGEVVMTAGYHQSGTERCYEALTLLSESYEAVINIQGDEPFIDPSQIDQVSTLLGKPDVEIATLCKRIKPDEASNPNIVKVVTDLAGRAMYFSRSPIPFMRNENSSKLSKNEFSLKHIGIYGYRSAVLAKLVALSPTPLEHSEVLEQLRWLENGFCIHIDHTDKESISIDTPEDIENL